MSRWRMFTSARLRYLKVILRLVTKSPVPLLESDWPPVSHLYEWEDDGLDLVITEGRRELDAQHAMLRGLRTRSQLVLTTSLAVLAGLASVSSGVTLRMPAIGDVINAVGVSAALLAILGSASVIVVGAPMGVIFLPDLSHLRRGHGTRDALASQYIAIARQNHRVVRTFHVQFFESVIWLVVAAICLTIRLTN